MSMRREGFSFVEIIVSLNILVLVLIPTADAVSKSLSKYKQYQQQEELLDILNNLAVYLQSKSWEIGPGDIKLTYVKEKEGYLYKNEFFSARHLKEKELRFNLSLKNTSEEKLKFAQLNLEDKKEIKREFFVFKREEL